MAVTQVSVDVPLRLQVMQSSVDELKKTLKELKPESQPFKSLENIIKNMTAEMEKLQIQTSKSFGSQQQFNQAGKTIDKLEESLARARIQMQNIKFSDLKLNKGQSNIVESFNKQFNEIEERTKQFKNQLKANILASGDNGKIVAEALGGNAASQSFDKLFDNLNNKAKELQTNLTATQNALNNLNPDKLTKAFAISQNGITRETLGEDLFDKFFTFSEEKGLRFQGGKGKGKEAFLEAFAAQFDINAEELKSKIDMKGNAAAINDTIKSLFDEGQLLNGLITGDKGYNQIGEYSEKIKTYGDSLIALQAVIDQFKASVAEGSAGAVGLEELDKQLEGVIQAHERYRQEQVDLARNNEKAQASFTGINQQIEHFRTELNNANAQMLQLQRAQQTFNSIKMAITNFMGFNQVLNMIKRAVQEAANHIKQLDSVMNGIAIVTDMSTADLWNQVDAYSEMAQRYGTTIQGAYEVSKIYYQAGYETNDVLTLMNETLKLSKISGLDYATTTDYMMTATRGFHMEVSEAAKVVDVYSALAANTAVSQQELAEAMTRTASSMEAVGATFEEASAMIATMVAVTRESANNIGSAMKSIASRYGELTKDPKKLLDAEGEAMSFNKVDEALKSVGISLQTADHQFRDFTDVIIELADKWDTLESAQQRYIATQFAGNRQQSRFLALVSNKDLLQQNLDVAAESEDTGTLQALKALDSLESKLNQVQVAYQQFYTTIGAEEVWKWALGNIKSYIDSLNSLPKVFGKVPVGAIAVLTDMVTLIKNIAIKGLSEFASIWVEKTREVNQETRVEGDKNQQNGQNWADNFIQGIKSRIGAIREVASEAIDAANEVAKTKAEMQQNNTPQGQSIDLNNGFDYLGVSAAVKKMEAATNAEDLENASIALAHYGLSLDDARTKLEEYRAANQNASQSSQEAGDSALSGAQKILAGAKGIAQSALASKNLANATSGLAMGLNTIAMMLNTTGQSGKAVAGTLMTLAGALRAGGAAFQYFTAAEATAFPWMAVITGVIGVINGIATAYENATERAERLTKQAEELNNEAKKQKANYNTLDRSIDKLNELEKKRYDSAEAAEEYQSAVEDLTEKFPQLAAGLDEAGNVIIDSVTAEATLTEARKKSLQATLDAAKGEYNAQRNAREGAQNELEWVQEDIKRLQEELKFRGYGLGYDGMGGEWKTVDDKWLEQYTNLDLSSETAKEDVQNLVDSYHKLDEQYQKQFKGYFGFLNDWIQGMGNLTDVRSLEDSSIKKLISAQAASEKGYEKLESGQIFLTDYLFRQNDIIDKNGIVVEAFNTKQEAYYKALEEANIDLNKGGERYNDYIEMSKNLNKYSINDWQLFFGSEYETNEAYLAIEDYYKNVYDYANNLKNRILENFNYERDVNSNTLRFLTSENNNIRISDLYVAIRDSEEKISGDTYNWLNNQIDIIKNLGQQGYIKAGNTLASQIADMLNNIPEEEASLIFSILEQYDISTLEGLAKAKQALENADVKTDLSQNFEAIESVLTYNIPLAIQSYTQDLVSNVDSIGEKFKKASSGFTGEEALEALNVLQAAGNQDFTLADFSMNKSGKLIIENNELRKAYFEALLQEQTTISTALQNRLDGLKNSETKGYLERLEKEAEDSTIIDQEQLGDYESILRSLGYIEENSEGQLKFTKVYFEQATEEGFSLIDSLDKWLAGAFQNSVASEEFLRKTLPAVENTNAGEYIRALNALKGVDYYKTDGSHVLDQLASVNAKDIFGLSYEDIKPIQEAMNSAYSTFFSDLLSKGINNLHFEDYKLDIDQNEFDSMAEMSYQQIAEKYAQRASLLINEQNDLIKQAIEKDNERTSGAAANAIKDITFIGNGMAYASIDTIEELANAFDIGLEKLVGKYNSTLDAYEVDMDQLSKEQLEKIANYSNVVADSITEFLGSIADEIGKGIEGKLDYAGRDNLISNLSQYGIELSQIDFTRTTDGLKLSENAAIRLYQEISKIDALQGQLVFEELRKSLEVPGSAFQNISTTTAKVEEIQRKIEKNQENINKLRNAGADSESYKNIEKENNELRKQLQLAQEIQRVQSQEPEQYNFMGRNLPDYLKGPENYWNSVGEAYKAMNESAESGYMAIDDYYNIVNEMSNLMQMSGNEIEFMGMTIDGSSESAAKLIEKGMRALSNIDGEGVKIDLSKLGANFTAGAKNMGQGFDGAVKEMAKSQIKMLDGMIKLLETVVAMEKLGQIDVDSDGILNFGEMFKKMYSENGEIYYQATANAQKTADQILILAETDKELEANLNDVSFNNKTLSSILKDLRDGAELSEQDAQMYNAALSSLYQMAISGEYDLDNLMSSIQSIAAKTGFIGEIKVGDAKIAIGYGVSIEANQDGKYTYNGKTYDTPDAVLKAAALENLGAENVNISEKEKVTGTITIGEKEIEVEQTEKGTKYLSKKTGQSYDSIDELIQEEFKADNPDGELTNQQLEEYKIKQGYKIVPEITADNIELSQTQIDNLVGKSFEELKKEFENSSEDKKIEFEAKYGFKLSEDTTEEDLNKLKKAQGIESKKVELTLSTVKGDDDVEKVLSALEKEEAGLSIPVKLDITVGEDKTGLFAIGDKENNTESILKNVTVTLNNGEEAQLAVTGIDTSTEIWTLKGINTDGQEIALSLSDIAGLTLSEDSWILNSVYSNGLGVDLGTASVTNLNQNEDGTWTLKDNVGGQIILTAEEVNGLINNEYVLTKDATGTLKLSASINKYGDGFNEKNEIDIDDKEIDINLNLPNYETTQDKLDELSAPETKTITIQYDNTKGTVIDNGDEKNKYFGNGNNSEGYQISKLDNNSGNWIAGKIYTTLSEAIKNIIPTLEADQFRIEKIDANNAPINAPSSTVVINGATITMPNEANDSKTSSSSNTTDITGPNVEDNLKKATASFEEAASQTNAVASSVEKIKTDKVDAIQAAQNKITHENIDAIQTAQSQIRADRVEAIRDAAALIDASHARAAKDAINQIDSSGAVSARNAINTIRPQPAQDAKEAINNIHGKDIEITANITVQASGGTVESVEGDGDSRGRNTRRVTISGNADAKGTLMGELGEELVVSNGKYFLVGQNGPEFVDLDSDAIVFNHLQTKKLMQNGTIPTRGQPVTNERKATSFASGNVSGPAAASASAALAALKQIRAMWQAMLGVSAKDLGAQAGRNNGKKDKDGSGGDDDKGNNFSPKTTTAEIQRWYNLLRQIEKLEKDITRQNSLQDKYLNDRYANGKKIYDSYQAELRLLNREIADQKELADLQRSWYDHKRVELEQSDYGKIFTFNEEGLMQYTGDDSPGSRLGLDILENLNRRDIYGQAIDNAETARKQLEYLQSVGFNIDNLKYNDDGTKVAEQRNGKFVKVERDENNQEVITDLTAEEVDNAYVQMMENFWSNVDGIRDELDSLYDSFTDTENQIIENQIKQNEIVQKIVDNQIEVENRVLDALEDMRQAQIDAAQDERDAYADAADKMINGLNDSLNKERQLYQNNQNQQEVERLQRQLAILQRSGGSGSQIQSLQQQLSSKQQDMYFNERQEQIDAIKEASDKQIERMDRQIELMTETLEYQKENGLLWNEVYSIMSQPESAIWQFIANNDKELQALSALQAEQEFIDTMQEIQIYKADQDAQNQQIIDGVGQISSFNVEEAYTARKSDVDVRAITDAINSLRSTFNFQTGSSGSSSSSGSSGGGSTAGGSGGSGGSSAGSSGPSGYWGEGTIKNGYQYYTYDSPGSTKHGPILADSRNGASYKIIQVSGNRAQIDEVYDGGKRAPKFDKRWMTYNEKGRFTWKKYKTGGLVDETGLVQIDGTPSRPEYILNAEQTQILREALIDNNPTANSLRSATYDSLNGMAGANTYSTINNDTGITFENVTMSINTPAISSDVGAQRAGELALNEMLRIARKTSNRSLSRR